MKATRPVTSRSAGQAGKVFKYAAQILASPDPSLEDYFAASQAVERMNSGFAAYFATYDALLCPVTPLPAALNAHVTYGSFNNYAKLSPQSLALWANLLAQAGDQPAAGGEERQDQRRRQGQRPFRGVSGSSGFSGLRGFGRVEGESGLRRALEGRAGRRRRRDRDLRPAPGDEIEVQISLRSKERRGTWSSVPAFRPATCSPAAAALWWRWTARLSCRTTCPV